MRPDLRLSLCHRIWFGTTLIAYVAFLVLMPPFQTNDEPSHWNRVWSVASGQLTCGLIPAANRDLIDALDYAGVRDGHKNYRFANLDAAMLLQGRPKQAMAIGNACVYIPVAYLLPALAMLPFVNPYDPRMPSGMLAAYYAARSANLLLMSAAVLAFLFLAPALRNLTLLLYSLPMTMQQATAINQESTILFCGFALIFLWCARSSLKQILSMFLFVTLLAMMKSIYLVLLLLLACAAWRLRLTDPRRWTYPKLIAIFSLSLVPLVIQILWTKNVVSVSGHDYLPGWGVSPEGQAVFLKQHPGHALFVMWHGFLDLFGRGHMNGGWISVYGVLGWADFELSNRAYYGLLIATVLAFYGDLRSAPTPPEFGGRSMGGVWGLLLERVLPIVSFLLVIPAVTMAMYFVFSGVGTPYALGVQGRYLQLPYFATLTLAVVWLRSRAGVRQFFARLGRVDAELVPWICMLLSWLGTRSAFSAVLVKYYSS